MMTQGKTILNAYGLEVAIAKLIDAELRNGASAVDALSALEKVTSDVRAMQALQQGK